MIDLKHCTFLIPTLIDTPDRLENLLLIVKYLTTHLDTNIFIGEQNNLKCVAEEQLAIHKLSHPKVRCYNVDYHVPYFNRQGIFNCMAKEVETKCLVLYDTDVLLKPNQYLMACKQIMDDKFDMVYPYDGTFYEIARHYRKEIFESLYLSNIDLSTCKVLNPDSLGGAIVYNREVFIKGGMENENFRGWGHEDFERFSRYQKLGYRQCRISDPLYHFEHQRVVSEFYIPDSDKNNIIEFFRLEKLTKEELLNEIKNWNWCK